MAYLISMSVKGRGMDCIRDKIRTLIRLAANRLVLLSVVIFVRVVHADNQLLSFKVFDGLLQL